MSWDVCRICLAGNIKMHSISNTQLQDIYEKLTGNQWIKERRPAVICYVCCSQLNKSQKLKEMCKVSEEVFTQLFAGGFEFTEETVPILNKRKLQKMLVTPVKTINLGTFSEEDILVKDEITQNKEQHVPDLDNRERKLQKMVTPVKTDTTSTFTNGNDKIQSVRILNKNKLQKLLVTPVETDMIGTFPKDADEIQSINYLMKQKLQKLLVTPIETYTMGTFLDDNDKIQSKQTLIKNKLQKLMVTPVETTMIGTFSIDADEIQSIKHNLQKQKLQKLLVTPVEIATTGTFSQNTGVKEEIITPKEEPPLELEAYTLGKMDTDKNIPHEKDNIDKKPISDDIIVYIPSHKTIDISSSNEDNKSNFKVESEMNEPLETYKTDNINDTDFKISKFKENIELNNTQSSQKNDFRKGIPCITLRFKINDNTHRNALSDAKQSLTRKRDYPFENENANGQYVCKYCDKAFMVRYRLEKHMIRHAAGKPFACDACDRTFKVKSFLELHKKIHTADKQFSCSLCDKAFHRIGYLNQHLKTHDKGKMYICGYCQKSFKVLATLKQHERTHTGEKPYACDECGKRFNQLSNLIQHKRLHSGEKPYTCEYCFKAFHQKSNLLQHVKRYHD